MTYTALKDTVPTAVVLSRSRIERPYFSYFAELYKIKFEFEFEFEIEKKHNIFRLTCHKVKFRIEDKFWFWHRGKSINVCVCVWVCFVS